MPVHNVLETLVRTVLDEAFVKPSRLPCACPRCLDDIMALALSRLPPRYVATDAGTLYVKAAYMHPQLQLDVYQELLRAAEVVAAHPHHGPEAGAGTPDGQAAGDAAQSPDGSP